MDASDAIWNDVMEVKTAEKMFKARTLNVAFWRNLKRFFLILELLLFIFQFSDSILFLSGTPLHAHFYCVCFFAFQSDFFWLSIQKFNEYATVRSWYRLYHSIAYTTVSLIPQYRLYKGIYVGVSYTTVYLLSRVSILLVRHGAHNKYVNSIPCTRLYVGIVFMISRFSKFDQNKHNIILT